MATGSLPDPRTVATRDDLARFVEALHDDLAAHADEWENASLERFLSTLAAWLGSADHWAENMRRVAPKQVIDVESPSWSLFARALRTARTSE